MKLFSTLVFIMAFNISFAQEKWLNYTNNFYVNDIEETEDGFWLSSYGGLCFVDDNSNQETYYNRGNSELPSNQVVDILHNIHEELWASTSLGICKISNGIVERGPNNLHGILNETLDGKIIVANSDSLYIQTDGMSFRGIAYPNYVAGFGGLEVDQITGAIYINVLNWFAETYVAKFENDAWTILNSEYIYDTSIVLDHNNRLWMLSTKGLSFYENGVWNFIPEIMEVEKNIYGRLFVDKNNDLIMEYFDECTTLRKWNHVELMEIAFSKDDCQDCNFIKPSEMEEDLFFASNRRNGFYDFSATETNNYQPYSQSLIVGNSVVNTLHTSDDSHYIISYNRIQELKGSTWTEIPVPSDLSGSIKSGHLDPNENLWIHDDHFLWKFENNQWEKINPPAEINEVISLMEIGDNGDIWIQSSLNIARLRNNQWENFRAIHHDITSSIIKDLKVDPTNGDLWVSSFQGIRHFDGTTWKAINTDLINANQCFRLAVSSEGVFVRAAGLYLIEDEVLNSVPMPDEGYYGPFESHMIYDENEASLYLTGSNYLAVYQNEEWTTYSTEDSGVYNGYSRDVSIDPKGNVWLSGSSGGLGVFNKTGIVSSTFEEEFVPQDWGVKLYPTLINNDPVFIESTMAGEFQIQIFDVSGKSMSAFNIKLNKNQRHELILPYGVVNGFFFIAITNGQDWITKKVVRVGN